MAKNENNEKKSIKENKQNKHYFKDMKAELKKVVWPTPKQLTNNTVAVIAFTLIIALIVFILDFCFEGINKYGITALQEKIQTSYSNSSEENTENDITETENLEEENQEENQESILEENEATDVESNE